MRWAAALCLAATVLGQGLLFNHFCRTQILPVYPRGYDQTVYLGTAYDLYDVLHDQGVGPAIGMIRSIDAPQGVLLQIEAALAQLVAGPGRLAALDVNFAHLVLFELALLALACRLQRPVLGLALCGLLVSARAIFHDIGGMPDFRLDFAAFCLFGTLICIAIRSSLFLRTGWTVAFGIGAGLLLLTRTIYAAYLVPGALMLAVIVLVLSSRRPESRRASRVRLINLAWASAVGGAIVVPSLVQRWHAIDAYYLAGHRSGEAAVRASELGVSTQWDHLSFYAWSVVAGHSGPLFLLLAFLICATLIGRRPRDQDSCGVLDAGLGLGWLLAMAVGIYAVLTADASKSPIVGVVFLGLAIPAVLLLAGVSRLPRESDIVRIGVLLGVFAVGQAFFAWHMLRRGSIPGDSADMREYGRVMDTIARVSQHLGNRRPVVSFDAVTELTHVGVLKVLAFERLGIRLAPVAGLGSIDIGLAPVTAAAAHAQLHATDFAVLGIDHDPHGEESYPVNISLRTLSPALYAQATREMVRVTDASFFGRHVTLFMKPGMHCDSERDPAITTAGVECRTAGPVGPERSRR